MLFEKTKLFATAFGDFKGTSAVHFLKALLKLIHCILLNSHNTWRLTVMKAAWNMLSGKRFLPRSRKLSNISTRLSTVVPTRMRRYDTLSPQKIAELEQHISKSAMDAQLKT